MKNLKRNKVIILIVLALIIMFFLIAGILNRERIKENINNIRLNRGTLYFEYQIYNNDDSDKIGLLITIESDNGIDYIEEQNGNKIFANGKKKIGIDYVYNLGDEVPFKIREIGESEITKYLKFEQAGNEQDPFLIHNAQELQNIQTLNDNILLNINKSDIVYKLANDINLNDYSFQPIGSTEDPFVSTLDGDGHKIYNWTYENEEEDYVGLFRKLSGTIKNIQLEDINIKGNDYVGGLAGYYDGVTKDVFMSTTVTGNNYVGGLCGYSNKELSNATINTIVNGNNYTGALVGYANNLVANNTTNGSVTASGNHVGGVVGASYTDVISNISNASVKGVNNVGGVIGYSTETSSIRSNQSTGNIEGKNYVGGIIGYVLKRGGTSISINENSSRGDITGSNSYIGGIVGYMRIGNSGNSAASGYVDNCFSSGNITGESSYIGGLIGYCSAEGHGSGGVGHLYLRTSYSASNVEGESYVGGLIGDMVSHADGSYYTGTSHCNITNCFSTGKVKGTTFVGGIAGILNREGSSKGVANINISYVYSVGRVEGETNYDPLSIVNSNSYGSFNDSGVYWESQTSGLTTSTYGKKVGYSEMFHSSTFEEFNFQTIWTIEEGDTLPYLQNLDKPNSVNK